MIKEMVAFVGVVGLASLLFSFSAGSPKPDVVEASAEVAKSVPKPVIAANDLWESDDWDGESEEAEDPISFGELTMNLEDDYGGDDSFGEDAGKNSAAASRSVASPSPASPESPGKTDHVQKMNRSAPMLAV